MKHSLQLLVLLCAFTINAQTTYNDTFILNLLGDKTSVGHISNTNIFTADVYTANYANTTSFSSYNNKLYIISQNGSSYITELNPANFSELQTINNSEVTKPSYLQMFSDTEGIAIYTSGSGRRKKYYAAFINTTTGIGERITELSDKVLFDRGAFLLNDTEVLIADNKDLKVLNTITKTFTTAQTFNDVISGIVKDSNGAIWIATEKRTNTNAQFVKLNSDYSINKTIDLDANVINLYKNSILNMNPNSNYAYWSESASGNIYRFNTLTETTELFATPTVHGIFLNAVVKEHPETKQVYVLGLEDWVDDTKNKLVIYNEDKSSDISISNIGAAPIDIYFSNVPFNSATASSNEYIFKQNSVYPNPVKTELTISNIITPTKVKIYNSVGVLVNEQTTNTGVLNIKHLAKGIYFLSLNNSKTSIKFIKK